jgi:DNA repair exonuclease SbcCD ATPase subunit
VTTTETAPLSALRPLVTDYLATLDDEVRLQEVALGQLSAINEAVASRDEAALQRLMAEADAAQAQFVAAEERRRAARDRLAGALGWRAEEATLSRLARALPGADGLILVERRRRIEAMAREVRRRHLQTAALLAECARINRALLMGLLPELGDAVRTYGTGGMDPWRPGAGLVDARS